jgi:hypothetical protein
MEPRGSPDFTRYENKRFANKNKGLSINYTAKESVNVTRGKFKFAKVRRGTASKAILNPLKPTLVYVIFKDPVRTSKRTPHLTITKINWLTLFKFKQPTQSRADSNKGLTVVLSSVYTNSIFCHF